MNVPVEAEGLHNERTLLAWQRTSISLAAGALVVARLTWADVGVFALVAPVLAAGVSALVWAYGRRTYTMRTDTMRTYTAASRDVHTAVIGLLVVVSLIAVVLLEVAVVT